jgi:hypothetical protein
MLISYPYVKSFDQSLDQYMYVHMDVQSDR